MFNQKLGFILSDQIIIVASRLSLEFLKKIYNKIIGTRSFYKFENNACNFLV